MGAKPLENRYTVDGQVQCLVRLFYQYFFVTIFNLKSCKESPLCPLRESQTHLYDSHAIPYRKPTSFQPFWWVVTRLATQQHGLWLSRCSMGVWARRVNIAFTGITSCWRPFWCSIHAWTRHTAMNAQTSGHL
jgi:hypothetical protein